MSGATTPMTDSGGREHEVSGEEVVAGRVAGLYRALCGARIGPAALTAAPGRPCAACVLELDPAPDVEPVADPRAARRAVGEWLHRLVDRTGSLAPDARLPAGGLR